MRCDAIQERFVDLLYGEKGTPSASEELRAHIASCPACRAELERLRAVREWLQSWKEERPSRPVVVRGLAAARARQRPWLRYGAIAAALTLAFLGGFAVRARLFPERDSGSDYYTKAEVRQLVKQVVDDTEARTLETNYLMMQRLLDTIEQERWNQLRYAREQSRSNHNRN